MDLKTDRVHHYDYDYWYSSLSKEEKYTFDQIFLDHSWTKFYKMGENTYQVIYHRNTCDEEAFQMLLDECVENALQYDGAYLRVVAINRWISKHFRYDAETTNQSGLNE